MLKQNGGQYCTESLKTLLITLEVGFEQLLLFLQCCPAESSMDPNRAALTLNANALPIIAASQNDEVWKSANALLKDNLNSVKAIAKRFHVLFMPFEVLSINHPERSTHTSLLSSKNFEFLEQCCATIKDLRTRSKELKRMFEGLDVVHPIWENIAFLDTKMECFLNLFEKSQKSADIENREQLGEKNHAIEQYESALEHLINTILLVIQKKYKDHINIKEDVLHINKKPSEENDNDVEKEAEEKLNVKLVGLLERDVTELKLSDVCNSFFNLLSSIREFDLQSANYCTR